MVTGIVHAQPTVYSLFCFSSWVLSPILTESQTGLNDGTNFIFTVIGRDDLTHDKEITELCITPKFD